MKILLAFLLAVVLTVVSACVPKAKADGALDQVAPPPRFVVTASQSLSGTEIRVVKDQKTGGCVYYFYEGHGYQGGPAAVAAPKEACE